MLGVNILIVEFIRMPALNNMLLATDYCKGTSIL